MTIAESANINIENAEGTVILFLVFGNKIQFNSSFCYLMKKTSVNNNERNVKRFNNRDYSWSVADS